MILVIDNYDSFTWNLVQRLGELDPTIELGRDIVVVRNDAMTVDEAEALADGAGPTHVIISPGPCTPNEAGCSAPIADRFAGRVPVLGVCLGHQAIAQFNGMRVGQHSILMHGKTSLVEHDGKGLFTGVQSPFEATRYHSLVVRPESIPEAPAAGEDGWEVTATTREVDGSLVVQGLRRIWASPTRPDGTAYAPLETVQFHPESFMTPEGPKILANFLAMAPRRVGAVSTT